MGTTQGAELPLPSPDQAATQPDAPNKRAIRKGFQPVFLDALNFLLSDVRGALGPYLIVFLVTEQHWTKSSVGVVTMIGGLLGLAAQLPIGMAIDAVQAKRAIVVASIAVLAVGATVIFLAPWFWPVLVANTLMAVVGDVFAPAIAAITLGLYARDTLARRTGRNAAFDHAGNVMTAVLAAGVGYAFSQRAVFLLVPAFAVVAAAAALAIPGDSIDQARARGADPAPGRTSSDHVPASVFKPTGWLALAKMRPLAIFAACALLFQFANASLLPLVGQKLATANPEMATALTSACIIAAQAVMMPIAMLVGWTADSWGRKPLFLMAFAVLPIRAVLYTFSDNTIWLLSVQLLDGVGWGIFSALMPLLIADIARGTGRYNMAMGAVVTMQGIGGSLSGLAAGLIVDHVSYSAAFLVLGSAAAIAFVLFFLFMPETADEPKGLPLRRRRAPKAS
jgi:MFS family permease